MFVSDRESHYSPGNALTQRARYFESVISSNMPRALFSPPAAWGNHRSPKKIVKNLALVVFVVVGFRTRAHRLHRLDFDMSRRK
jgi:hypothetical protein